MLSPLERSGNYTRISFCHFVAEQLLSLKSCHLSHSFPLNFDPCHQVGNFNFHVNEFSSTVASQFLDFYTSSHTSTCTFPSLGTVLPLKSEAPLIITFYLQALNLLNFRGDPLDCFLLFYPPFLYFHFSATISLDLMISLTSVSTLNSCLPSPLATPTL